MNRIIEIVDSLLMKITINVIALMTITIIISVFLRYLFGISYVWVQELIVFMFIFTTFFGSVLAFRRGEHLSIDIFSIKFPDKAKKIVNIFFDISILYLYWQVIKVSFKWINKVGNVVTPGIRIPMKYLYFILPLSAVFMIFYVVIDVYQRIKNCN
ncbi:TRAP transporter small permease subunit [Iocasia frigidifontis]|uniref:TRAP transporter small permease subunit n=1 Tax=Iocasia fonsfrigidae TaxID=2682810 RepID=A0A8A7KEE3_9FIRM|nr:TRAP transporter small permease [Iocasia fonsfrigidae]QTL99630.1 TRAP transporter small permease subunit [Iocasia fonsfrigidae]